jgi:hypothetical protein
LQFFGATQPASKRNVGKFQNALGIHP